MTGQTLLLLTVGIPLLGAFLLPLAGRVSPKLRNALAFVLVAAPLLLSAIALPNSLKEPSLLQIPLPFSLSFGLMADGLAVFMAISASLIGLIIVGYSYGYMSHSSNQSEYYFFVVLFIGAMMGIVYSTDLIFLYLFWEISALCCWRLIGFFREKEFVRRANKAFLLTVFGALLMLAGFIMIYVQNGTTDLLALKGQPIATAAVILILFGVLSKSATLPLHSWIADAGVAPSPVTSLLHAAVLVKIGVYVFARLFLVNFVLDDVWHTVVPVIAAISSLTCAGAAVVENDIKRIIAYSTVSQIGYIFLGISVGGELAAAGGILYILMHGISKAGLFLCAGIVEHTYHTKDIRELGGLMKTMPVTAVSFLLCAFSVMGIPPFGGFFSKYMVVNGAAAAGHPWIAFTFLLGAVFTIVYLLRAFTKVFLGEPKRELKKEGTRGMVFCVALLAALSLVSGLLVQVPAGFVESLVQQLVVAA